jgi:hypothetical protein
VCVLRVYTGLPLIIEQSRQAVRIHQISCHQIDVKTYEFININMTATEEQERKGGKCGMR